MSSFATVPQVAPLPESITVTRPAMIRRGSRRKWLVSLLGAVVLSPALLVLPPVWQGALRTFLTWQASRDGYELTVARVSGGMFGETRLDGLRVRHGDSRTDLIVKSAKFAVAWRLPWSQRTAPWMREIRLEGIGGRLDFAATGEILRTRAASQWLPTDFSVQSDDLQIVRGTDSLRLSGFVLTGKRDTAGEIAVREVRAAGFGYERIVAGWHGRTLWKDNRLTLVGLDLGNGVSLASATFDASQLDRRHLDWECNLAAFGGEVRGQGAVYFSRERIALEVAATLRRISLASLARTTGTSGTVDGQVEEASFTFRGDPENLPSAQTWLSIHATNFQKGDRRWEDLEAQAIVVNRCVQLHRFALRQHGNRLSLAGEFPLPPGDSPSLVWTGNESWWRAGGFACRIDARLEDLHALSDLVGSVSPDLAGRMSINGELHATPQRAEVEGYLNVEGTRLTICGAPLDFLRSTLLFRGGAMEVADLQATHDMDYLTAHGVIGLSGEHAAPRGEARAEIKAVGPYAQALAALPGIGERAAAVRRLDATVHWENGDVFFDEWDAEPTAFLLAR